MLVQRQTPKRLRKLLIGGGVILVPILGYIAYLNFFQFTPAADMVGTVVQKIVPADFGQKFFRDPRFNALVPKQGTALITQSAVTVPSDVLPAPQAVQVFDMQTGGTVLFTWKKPEGTGTATGIRLNLVTGENQTNIVTLPATATSFQYRGATDGAQTTYELHYIAQVGVEDSPGRASSSWCNGWLLTVAAATNDGVKLTWYQANQRI